MPKRSGIVGIKSRMEPGAADGHIELLSVDELSAAHRVDIENHAVNRGTLGGVGSGGVAVIDVPELRQIDG